MWCRGCVTAHVEVSVRCGQRRESLSSDSNNSVPLASLSHTKVITFSHRQTLPDTRGNPRVIDSSRALQHIAMHRDARHKAQGCLGQHPSYRRRIAATHDQIAMPP